MKVVTKEKRGLTYVLEKHWGAHVKMDCELGVETHVSALGYIASTRPDRIADRDKDQNLDLKKLNGKCGGSQIYNSNPVVRRQKSEDIHVLEANLSNIEFLDQPELQVRCCLKIPKVKKKNGL